MKFKHSIILQKSDSNHVFYLYFMTYDDNFDTMSLKLCKDHAVGTLEVVSTSGISRGSFKGPK